MENCIFCKIASGAVPAHGKKMHRNETIMSFLDINPKAPGHTLVIPVLHTAWFLDMEEEPFLALMSEAKKIAQTLKNEYNADYVQVGIVGKDVPHVHVHLIPRTVRETNVF